MHKIAARVSRKSLCIILLLLFVSFLQAQENTAIDFKKELSWQQVLDTAKAANKIVFVDVYTDWCVPCKRMESEIFSLKNIADTFNKKFINYRINAEKGDGIDVAKRYGVTGYPYFVFVDGNGTLYYSMLGYRDERQLLADAMIAFREVNSTKPYGLWKEEYDANRYDAVWMKGYIEKRNKLRMDNKQLIEDYYALLKPADYMKADNLLLINGSSGINLNGKVYKIVTKGFNSISPKEDTLYHLQENLLNIFEGAINRIAVKAIEEKDEATILRDVVPAHAAFPEKVSFMPWYNKQATNWRFIFYQHTNNFKKGMPVAVELISRYYMNLSVTQIRNRDSIIYEKAMQSYKARNLDTQQWKNMQPMLDRYYKAFITNDHLDKLMNASRLVYNNDAGPAALKTALSWITRALQIQESSTTYEQQSKILYRLGRKQEALTAMQSAIEKADNPTDRNRLTLLLSNIQENKRI